MMRYRKLGKTDLDVGVVGLGTEYLHKTPHENVVSVIHEALDHGVNYFDVVFAFAEYRDNLAAAFKGHRERIVLTAHLGSAEKDGQYRRTRNRKLCEQYFLDELTRFETDHVDVLLLHNVNTDREYDELLQPGGLLEMATRYRQEGKTRFIGLSGHPISMALKAAASGHFDMLMLPINMLGNALPGRAALLRLCARQGVGIVAMKPFAGGKLFESNRTVYVAKYATGGASAKRKILPSITPTQCIDYVLSQPAVATTVPGVRNVDELRTALAYLEATEEERDFSPLLAGFQDYVSGECVYCNHCLPCPSAIDIGAVLRLASVAASGVTDQLHAEYEALAVKASTCIDCGACTQRCPFGVSTAYAVKQAAQLFEKIASR